MAAESTIKETGGITCGLLEEEGAVAEAKLSASELWGLGGDNPEHKLGHVGLNEAVALLVNGRRGDRADLFQLENDLVDGLVLLEVALDVLHEELAAQTAGRISSDLRGLEGFILEGPGSNEAEAKEGQENTESNRLVHCYYYCYCCSEVRR